MIETTTASTQIGQGSIVKLKSGGPSMTVESLTTDGKSANCLWHAADLQIVVATIGLSALQVCP